MLSVCSASGVYLLHNQEIAAVTSELQQRLSRMTDDFAADLDEVEQDRAKTVAFRMFILIARNRRMPERNLPDEAEAVEGRGARPRTRALVAMLPLGRSSIPMSLFSSLSLFESSSLFTKEKPPLELIFSELIINLSIDNLAGDIFFIFLLLIICHNPADCQYVFTNFCWCNCVFTSRTQDTIIQKVKIHVIAYNISHSRGTVGFQGQSPSEAENKFLLTIFGESTILWMRKEEKFVNVRNLLMNNLT